MTLSHPYWNDLFARVGLAWVMSKRVVDFLENWRGLRGNLLVAIWRMVLFRGAFGGKGMKF